VADDPAHADERLAALSEAYAADPEVEVGAGRGFGSTGTLKVGGRIFAMSVAGRLVLKLPRARVGALVEAGDGHPFRTGKGSPMKEWVALDERCAPADVHALAAEALAFVRRPA
jgi:hypothetical protein